MKFSRLAVLTATLGLAAPAAVAQTPQLSGQLHGWLSRADQQLLLATDPQQFLRPAAPAAAVVSINSHQRFQTMQGFGYTLTGGSAMHLMALPAAQRAALLQELFGPQGIGVSYLRLSLGASDLDPLPFSYNDLAPGETDPTLKKFSLAPDEQLLIPLLKQILAIRPDLQLLASPWSPPAWMKSNQRTVGGELLEQYYPAYAQYFVRYLQGMAAHGIRIGAVTVQNEPLHPGNNPSLLMHAWDQATFVGKHLGPAFAKAGLATDILIYDHNPDHVEYPLAVLSDPVARRYIKGSAFHLYNGSITELSRLKAAYPDKDIYFTEQWVGANSDFGGTLMWHTEHLLIGAVEQHARTVLEWNLAADADYKPYTPGGCTECLGALTITAGKNAAEANIQRNVAYYVIAHAGKIAPPGSVRIGSKDPLPQLLQLAYQRPDGRVAVLLQNQADSAQTVRLALDQRAYDWSLQLPPHSVLSLILPAAAGAK